MILAAGAGTRLYPLTAALPKPMVPVANEPVLAHVIRNLHRQGFDQLAINLSHLPDAIRSYFGDGSAYGVSIRYSFEPEPLGTAGGVKRLGDFWDQDFLVIGGDDLTDMELSGMIAFHRQHQGLATIALYPVADPSLYGVAVLDRDRRITAFQEKPPRDEALSNLCNTGVYLFSPRVLELIPDGFHDFGRELFPALVAQGAPVYGYPAQGYWRDIGNPREYLAANLDLLCGRTTLPAREPPAGAQVHPGARLLPPVCLGEGVIVESGAIVGPNCVIGDRCHIHAGARLADCVLWPGVDIKKGTEVASAIVAPHCTLEVAP